MDRTRMPVAAFRVVTLAALAAGAIVTPVATAGDPVGASPGAISSSAASRHSACSPRFISTRKNFDSAAASSVMPSTQPTKVTTKS